MKEAIPLQTLQHQDKSGDSRKQLYTHKFNNLEEMDQFIE